MKLSVKLKLILILIFIFCITFIVSCNRNKTADDGHLEYLFRAEADTEEGFSAGFDDSGMQYYNKRQHPQILDGDFSKFTGAWVNNFGHIFILNADGSIGDNSIAYGFETNGDDANEVYSWYVNWGGESMGYYLTLYTAGAAAADYKYYPPQFIESDTTKVRIADTAKGLNSSDEIFYRESEFPVKIDAEYFEYIKQIIHKRVEAAEKGDIEAFRATLPPREDGADYNYQLNILNNFFGYLFDIKQEDFDEAFLNSPQDLDIIADKLFYQTPPVQSKNTGLHVTEIKAERFGFNVKIKNNKNEETEYYFPSSSF